MTDENLPAAGNATDPINAWATEHYGFDDDPQKPDGPQSPSTVLPGTSRERRPRRRTLLVAAALAMTLTGLMGGVAVAADGNNDGRDGVVHLDGNPDGRRLGDGFGGPADGRSGGVR
jgi:hypothetical protein